ncbi:DUF6542 domain-containing protein [Streptomyces sp. NPDC002537]
MTGRGRAAPSSRARVPQQSRHASASRGRAASGARRRGRTARTRDPAEAASAAFIGLALPVLGAFVDGLTGASPGVLFVLAAAAGAAATAFKCSRAEAWWVVCAPPIAVALITVIAEQATGRTSLQGKGLGTAAVHWAIDAFPAMAMAEAAVVSVLAVRRFRNQQNVRK